MDINGLANFFGSALNNTKIKEIDVSYNNLNISRAPTIQSMKVIRGHISSFMMSNKSLTHLLMTDCNINRNTSQFFVLMFSMRPSILLVHTDRNYQ